MPKRAKNSQFKRPINKPWVAALSASFWLRSPKRRLISELRPTPVPTATAISRFWIGKTSETPVSALSLTCATTLYKACTNIDIIAGNDIARINGKIGLVPILFCFFCSKKLTPIQPLRDKAKQSSFSILIIFQYKCKFFYFTFNKTHKWSIKHEKSRKGFCQFCPKTNACILIGLTTQSKKF